VDLLTLEFRGSAPAGAAAPLDLLCVAPHPDDAELGMGGLLALAGAAGLRAGVVDLSLGEMASNGSPEQRLRESALAAAVLGLRWRGNLGLPDRGLEGVPARRALAGVIRLLRPAAVFAPYADDPHPDHGAASRLAAEALFDAGLRRVPAPAWAEGAAAFRPPAVFHYFINGWCSPALAYDVTAAYETKRQAVAAHASQFHLGRREGQGDGEGVQTRLNTGAAMAQVESRDRFFGAQSGVGFAEGFVVPRPLLVSDPALLLGVARR